LERLQLLPDPHDVHRRVEEVKAEHPAASAAAGARREVTATVVRCTGVGVIAGLPGTIPGLGTFAQACATLGIAAGEAAILLRNVASLQYLVAGFYGHDLHAPERIEELSIVAALQSGAALPAREAGKRVGTKIAAAQQLGTTVLTNTPNLTTGSRHQGKGSGVAGDGGIIAPFHRPESVREPDMGTDSRSSAF
jgi:hypothetical protein